MAFVQEPAHGRLKKSETEPLVSINKKSIGFNEKAQEVLKKSLPNGSGEVFGVDLFYDSDTRTMGFIAKDRTHATSNTWKLYAVRGKSKYLHAEKVIQKYNLWNVTRSVLSKESFTPRVEGQMVCITLG